jgi:uroporphyrinogen-III decarboxylase
LPWELDYAVNLARRSGCPLVVLFLHKGSKGFMSEKQFRTFYWPTLRELMVGLVEKGLIPVMYTEGDYTPWFEIIKDFPPGKGVLHLDQGDIFKAKEILGDVWCLSGNVPNDLLCLGTPDQVEDYCKKLIDVAGEGGGFIMDAGSPFPDAKVENVRAMTEFTKEYG